jgi:hypothetical protein
MTDSLSNEKRKKKGKKKKPLECLTTRKNSIK